MPSISGASTECRPALTAKRLELALRRRLPLATLDQALLLAMQRCGVPAALVPTP